MQSISQEDHGTHPIPPIGCSNGRFFKSYKPARAIRGQLICSRTNSQLHLYCSLKPDPEALVVDALLILEGSLKIHTCFPHFVLIPRCLRKIEEEHVTALLVAPVWSNQIWFLMLLKSLIEFQFCFLQFQTMIRPQSSAGNQRSSPPSRMYGLSWAVLYMAQGFQKGIISIIR